MNDVQSVWLQFSLFFYSKVETFGEIISTKNDLFSNLGGFGGFLRELLSSLKDDCGYYSREDSSYF
jgi:hypothetical protein